MLRSVLRSMWSVLKTRRELALENLALRQQLAVMHRSVTRPRLSPMDRWFWVALRGLWTEWDKVLVIVKPDTVVRWHHAAFRRYWRQKSRRSNPGRRGLASEIRALIRDISAANPLWGAPRVHGELLKLGVSISLASVSKYIVQRRRPPSPTWQSFLKNHAADLVSIDFFTVPTACSTTVAASSTSTSRRIRPPRGPRSKSSRLFHGSRRPGSCSATEMAFTVALSPGV